MDHYDNVTLPVTSIRISKFKLALELEEVIWAKRPTECFGNYLSNTAL
jgi:hypothetical protein